ncbi:MAG: glutamine synthetase III [Desulfovibrio sp.]|jgi:glutamine synthetase|nr:glutamine synthetase III [Desulfovibrio sp.]
MPSTLRNTIRAAVAAEKPGTPAASGASPSEIFGRDVFSMKVMSERLPKSVYARLEQSVSGGEALQESDADVIAGAMRDWALERGATHYTHWFQPLTGATAEKHDAFLTPSPLGGGRIFSEFSGKMLIKGEPDASSFPSGGIRSTFEARGYTAWDPTSPAFLIAGGSGKTLYIPCVFVSYTGESLDSKTPLLRALDAVSRQALRILKLFGNTSAFKVDAMVGSEQEYFLIDRRYYNLRTDLQLSGRTVFGAKPCKGQELEDQYFGAISPRVIAFMTEVEEKLLALGIPARTRHNEVAPGQFEIAPMFEPANTAVDHNMLTMQIMRNTAAEHGFACLLHEKPFAGINGSGKHNNWSLCDSDGNNLLDPGSTPRDNAQFLVFLAAILRAVHKHAVALRLGVVGAGNDHRLGANEAPPAILSVFLGEQLTEIVESMAEGRSGTGKEGAPKRELMEIGVSSLPKLPKDSTDRNRTSPFAFTGNKFEFRAVGASQSIAPANIALSAAVACALNDIASDLEQEVQKGTKLNTAVQALLSRLFKEHSPIIFNGNNYAGEWQAEAERRGLPNLKDTVGAVLKYSDEEVKEVFLRHGILNERELHARQEVLLENYIKDVHVETKLTQVMGRSVILPAAVKFAAETAAYAAAAKQSGHPALSRYQALLDAGIEGLLKALDALDAKHLELDAMEGVEIRAEAARDKLLPLISECREYADALESIVDDAVWPLPKYNEMLWQH